MIHKLLMRLTRRRPMKTIEVMGMPYLERYYMGGCFGYQVWLHRFLSADGERHLHTHPWTATSIVLSGWYWEECPRGSYERREPWSRLRIAPSRLHRIQSVRRNTWTLMIVSPGRLPFWEFVDDEGNTVLMKTSPEDWWKDCGVRK